MSSLGLQPLSPDADDRVQAYGLQSWRCRPNLMTLPHRHSDMELNFLLDGEIVYRHRDRLVCIGAGRLALFWAAIPHQLVERPTHCDFCILTIPLDLFLGWDLPEHFVQALLLGDLLLDRDAAQSQVDRVLAPRWHADLQAGRRQVVLKEIEARCWRMAQDQMLTPSTHHGPPDDRAGLMATYIIEHHAESLTVAMVAHQVGLHPSTAMACFKESFRMTILEYLTHYRVTQAQRLLATTDLSVLEVGYRSGFGSASSFHTAFKRQTGLAPRAYRRRVVGPAA